MNSTLKKGGFVLSLVLIAILFVSCKKWVMPETLVGTWKSQQEVTVRFKEKGEPFEFLSEQATIIIRIKNDGTIEGNIGNANLTGSQIIKNRSWFGKLFNFATDYHVKGKIQGKVFEGDPVVEKEFNFPFNMENDLITGTIYQKQGIGISPMVDVRLVRE